MSATSSSSSSGVGPGRRGRDRGVVLRADLEHHSDLHPGVGRVGDQRRRARIAEDVVDFIGRQAEIDRNRYRRQAMTREQRLDELDPVVKQQRNAIARLHAAPGEDRREPCRAIVELRMGQDVVAEHDGRVVRARPARPAGELRQHHPA